MSCIVSIHQHNRGVFIEAANYTDQTLAGMYLKICVGKDEIVLHLEGNDVAERIGRDILNCVEKLEERETMTFDERGEPCPPT